MTVEEKVYTILSNDAPLVAVVPAARIKPPGDWQELQKPYIVHFPVAVDPIHTHGGRAALQIWRFYQVSIYGRDSGEAARIRELVKSALDGYCDSDVDRIAYLGIGLSHFDTDLKLHHMALNFEVAEGLEG